MIKFGDIFYPYLIPHPRNTTALTLFVIKWFTNLLFHMKMDTTITTDVRQWEQQVNFHDEVQSTVVLKTVITVTVPT